MSYAATVHLHAENLPDKDSIGGGTSDPYFELSFEGELLYKSETKNNADKTVAWKPAEFIIPKAAFLKPVQLKIMDKDTLSDDDVIAICEIRYPFKNTSYPIGEKGATINFMKSTVKVPLQIKVENLCNTEIFGTADPYFKLYIDGEEIYKSLTISNNIESCEWPEVELEIPTKTINYGIMCKIMDDDHCSDDDLMAKVQLSWPFHEKVYEIEDKGGEAKLYVLNSNGDLDPEEAPQEDDFKLVNCGI